MKKFTALFLLFTSFVFADFIIEDLSESPHIKLISNFLSDEECEYLIAAASPGLSRSLVVDPEGKADALVDERRTSEGAFLANSQDPILRRIEKRISEITDLPEVNGEPLQVLHYNKGAEFQPHHDYFDVSTPGGKACAGQGGQRFASFVIYLNTPEKGGETVFPEAGISVTPKKGNAVLFYNCLSTGEIDPLSLHGGAPVIEGEKWIANKWIRTGRYR